MTRTPPEFLTRWLQAFRRSRVDNHDTVSRFVERLGDPEHSKTVGPTESPTKTPSSTDGKPFAMGGGWNATGTRLGALGLVRAILSECRTLRAIRQSLGQAPQWVIADDRRTGMIEGQQSLRRLWVPLTEAPLPEGLAHALRPGRPILVFTPNLIAIRPPSPLPGIAHLGYLSLFAMPLLHPVVFALAAIRGASSLKIATWTDRQAWITVLLASCTQAMFKRHPPDGLALVTSNSFVVELMRYLFVATGQRGVATEVLHGIPTLEIEAYHAEMERALTGWPVQKPCFVPPVHGLNLRNFPLGSVPPGVAINLKFNDIAGHRDLLETARRSMLRLESRSGRPVVSLMGAGNLASAMFTGTRLFAIECAILAHIRRRSEEFGLGVHLQYAIHPAHIKSGLKDDIASRLDGAEILDDTFVAWLESDLSIAILSSACWEARALGCRVVIGIGPEAGIYSAELLESLAYPQPGDTIFDVIDHELSCMSAATRASPMARLRNMPTRTLAS